MGIIHYPESKTFSTKIKLAAGPDRHLPDKLATVRRERRRQMGLMSAAYQDVKEYLLGAPDHNTDLYNYYNLQYYGPIYMGDNRETIDVVWDTGSFIYLAETDACSACD